MKSPKRVLGIETSCDECSVALVEFHHGNEQALALTTLGLSTHSQIQLHAPFGGVVPEIASRNHLETINQTLEQCLKTAGKNFSDIDAIAATNRPGLVGALLVGVSAGKTLSYALQKSFIPVHHIEGHISSLFLDNTIRKAKLPLLVAVVSGGHTQLHIMTEWPENWSDDFLNESLVCRSRDDAAGEAFDKAAKMLGLSYPGGRAIDEKSKTGDPKKYSLPRALPQKSVLEYSFSGLKTAVSLLVQSQIENGTLSKELPHLCASIQEAIIDTLLSKMKVAKDQYHCRSVAVVGGVSANSRLRHKLEKELNLPSFFPAMEYCTDNAAMIAAAGGFRYFQQKALDKSEFMKITAFGSDQKFMEAKRALR